LPNVKVQGLLTGSAYPELSGSYQIISSSGYVAVIDFSGKKMLGFGGTKNGLHAEVFESKDTEKNSPLYSVDGSWSGTFTIRDEINGTIFETHDSSAVEPSPIKVTLVNDQDPWESRKAWAGTINALNGGQMKKAANEKSKVEQGQRQMRKMEAANGENWEPIFFAKVDTDTQYTKLTKEKEPSFGFWKFDANKKDLSPPFHGQLIPTNQSSPASSPSKQTPASAVSTTQPHNSQTDVPSLQETAKTSTGVISGERGLIGSASNPYSMNPLDPRVASNEQ
jgi:hypothetical protein